MNGQEILNKYSNMAPGKYWSLPANKKHLIDDYLEDKNYLPMIKTDGYWARVIIYDRKVLIQSRGISTATGTYGDYTPLVPHIVEELLRRFPDNTVLIGELAFKDLSRKVTEVGSILRCLPAKAIKRQEKEENKIIFFPFDVLVFNGEEIIDKPFYERFITIPNKNLPLLNLQDEKYVLQTEINDYSGTKLLEHVWGLGGEGIILIKKDLPYNIGNAKAWHSIKVKRELGELEGKVIGLIEPNKLYEGKDLSNWQYFIDDVAVTKPYFFNRKVGVVVEYLGRKINMTSGTTDDDGEFLSTPGAAKMIEDGTLYAVFTGMELTPDSVRHPRLVRLRDDV